MNVDVEIGLIYARTYNNIIGIDNKLPWEFNNEDMNNFKKITNNNIVIMGKNTYISIGKPLKDRINIVLSKSLYDYNEAFEKYIDFIEYDLYSPSLLKVNRFDEELYVIPYKPNILNIIKYFGKSVYFIGGVNIFNLGLLHSSIVYETVFNKNFLNDYKNIITKLSIKDRNKLNINNDRQIIYYNFKDHLSENKLNSLKLEEIYKDDNDVLSINKYIIN